MLPKKRAAPAATAPAAVKRKKMSKATTTTDITTTNSISSPLLRLPAELRRAIWNYAYADMMVAVYSKNRQNELDESETVLMYYICEDISTGRSMIDPPDALARPPDLVCKQFWVEASRIFLYTCTLKVAHPRTMLALVSTKQGVVQCARNLVIVYEVYDLLDGLRDWAKVLNVSTIGRFRNLEGLELHLWIGFFNDWMVTTNSMNHNRWQKAKLPHIVRAFQQHKLKNPLFQIHIDDEFDSPDDWLAQLHEAVRKELLDHQPRRVSKRGRGEDGF